MAELTDESNRAFAFSLFPVTWVVGATLGTYLTLFECLWLVHRDWIAPLLGGALQHPAETYPKTFRNVFWSNYPYFLPCSIIALFAAFTYLVALAFLKEAR